MTESPGKTLALMGSCYALGTFADNFYKQAAVLMAAAAQMTGVQSLATVLFSLPFVLFSAWAGWLADRAPKKNIVVSAKGLELAAMLLGGWMLFTVNWTGILVVMFLMAGQSTLFSPAINGSIPEYFPAARVPRVNSLIRLASTAAILAGMALAGVFLDLRPEGLWGLLPAVGGPGGPLGGEAYGRAASAQFLVCLSCAGILTALFLSARPAASAPPRPFPWTGPLDSLRHAAECRRDPALFLVLLADSWFYGVSVVAVISIANLATVLGYSNTVAGLLSAVLMVGVALGSLVAGRRSAESWRRLLLPSACGISLMLCLTSATPLFPADSPVRLAWFAACLFLCGVCGGIYLIPLESFIQIRPGAAEKGKIIAVSNFLSFSAMALFGAAFQAVSLLPPALTFLVFGLATAAFAMGYAAKTLARLEGRSMKDAASGPLALLSQALFSLRYRVEEEGLEALPAPGAGADRPRAVKEAPRPGVLFLPNHPALIDPPLLYSRLAGLRPRPLADRGQMDGPLQRLAGRLAGVVTIPDMNPDSPGNGAGNRAASRRRDAEAVRLGIAAVTEALRRGENVLLYPSGRIYRGGREQIGNNSAAARVIAAVPEARVILVRTRGLWGSSFSRASGKKPRFMAGLARACVTLLANALFFAPRRKVRIRFDEAAGLRDLLAGENGKSLFNRYLEDYYNEDGEETPQRTPRFFWQRRTRPEPKHLD